MLHANALGIGSHTHKQVVKLYNSSKMRDLQNLITKIQQATSISEVIIGILKNIRDVVNCCCGSFFLFKNDILSEKERQQVIV